eukprot:5921049-Amphidinium_carterae.1
MCPCTTRTGSGKGCAHTEHPDPTGYAATTSTWAVANLGKPDSRTGRSAIPTTGSSIGGSSASNGSCQGPGCYTAQLEEKWQLLQAKAMSQASEAETRCLQSEQQLANLRQQCSLQTDKSGEEMHRTEKVQKELTKKTQDECEYSRTVVHAIQGLRWAKGSTAPQGSNPIAVGIHPTSVLALQLPVSQQSGVTRDRLPGLAPRQGFRRANSCHPTCVRFGIVKGAPAITYWCFLPGKPSLRESSTRTGARTTLPTKRSCSPSLKPSMPPLAMSMFMWATMLWCKPLPQLGPSPATWAWFGNDRADHYTGQQLAQLDEERNLY